jgi:tRNA wybutosine-synthesizing protein 2
VAYQYLTKNIKLNHVENIVQPTLGDNRKSIQPGIAHRILMGYIKTEHSHRHAAFKILKPSGGVIHFHDVGFKDSVVKSATQKIQKSLVKSGFDTKFQTEVYNQYIIKSYGPKLSHVVLDIRFSRRLDED